MFFRSIKYRFHRINTSIKNCILVSQLKNDKDLNFMKVEFNYQSNNLDKTRNLVNVIRHLHHELCDIARNWNSTFEIQILVGIVVNFGMTIQLAFYCLCYILKNFETHDYAVHHVYGILLFMIWASFYFSKVLFISMACSSATEEANKTSNYLCELNGKNALGLDEEVCEE